MPNFLGDYLLFNSGNEANQSYHIWAGLSALSSIVSRRVWIDMGYFRIYPNLYVVLVGPAGNKKTTALSSAKGLIRQLKTIPFSAECQTKESLVKEWEQLQQQFILPGVEKPLLYTPMSIFVTELSQFIGVDPARMIDFLVTVYDQDFYDVKTKNKGNNLIVGPYISLLACTTPDWITAFLRIDVINGGFSRRTIFVNETIDGKRIPFPSITPEQHEAWERVVAHSYVLLSTGGPFKWAPDAATYYEHWYKTRSISKDPMIAGFDGTLPIQTLKVAMLLACAKHPDLILTLEDFQAAQELMSGIMTKLPAVFSGMGRNELNSVRAKISNMLTAYGPMLEKKLISTMYSEASGRDLMDVLKTMEETDQIVRARQTIRRAGAPEVSRIWIALKVDEGKIEDAVKKAGI